MTPALEAALLDELGGELKWWWLSFCDAALPKGTQFLGAICVRAPGPCHAIRRAHLLGLNPGGEVAIEALAGEPPAELAEALVRDRRTVERIRASLRSN